MSAVVFDSELSYIRSKISDDDRYVKTFENDALVLKFIDTKVNSQVVSENNTLEIKNRVTEIVVRQYDVVLNIDLNEGVEASVLPENWA